MDTDKPGVIKRLRRLLPEAVNGDLSRLSALAHENKVALYLVGGSVRDILLGRKSFDLDCVVEGDAVRFSRYAATIVGADAVLHRRFGTATLYFRHGEAETDSRIDLAGARKEHYASPAELPEVSSATLKEDLSRRDFTINAMAISLNRSDYGRLIDYFGGRKDLEKGVVRVLHDKSFIDDPTRIFRAVRFEQRFGFKIEKSTEALIRTAAGKGIFDEVSGERLRHEIEKLLGEGTPVGSIERMRELHELKFINPAIDFTGRERTLCRRIKRVLDKTGHVLGKDGINKWLVYFMAVIDTLSLEDAIDACGRLAFKRGERLKVVSLKRWGDFALRTLREKGDLRASEVFKGLRRLPDEAIIFLVAKASGERSLQRAKAFMTKYRKASLDIAGEDLLRLGIKPGPRFRKIMEETLLAKVDGKLKNRDEEIEYARRLTEEGWGP